MELTAHKLTCLHEIRHTFMWCLRTVLGPISLDQEKSIDVFEAKLSSPFGLWHSSWKIALTISVFTLTNGNLPDGNFPSTDTCCVFKNLDQLLCISYLGGFMLTDKKFGFCHTSPQGFP